MNKIVQLFLKFSIYTEGGVNKLRSHDFLMVSLQVLIEIVDDNQWEPDEEFFLKLSLVQSEDNLSVQLGRVSIMEITIMNDDGELATRS